MASERRINPGLDPATMSDLRAALSRSLETGAHGSDIAGLLREVARQARERGLHAEQLLIALKEVWYSMPQLSVRSGTEVSSELLQQLIARCIQEYYSG